jgi:hypothetical protein
MTKPKFDQDFWEQLWAKTLREHADKLALRPPNAHLMAEAANLPRGRALDAGCGHGADTLWLAAHGWQVTAVDFSAAALAHGRSMVEAAGADVAERTTGSRAISRPDGGVSMRSVVCLCPRGRPRWNTWSGGWRRRRPGGPVPVDTARSIPHRAATAAATVQVSVEGGCCARFPWGLVVAEERRAPSPALASMQ